MRGRGARIVVVILDELRPVLVRRVFIVKVVGLFAARLRSLFGRFIAGLNRFVLFFFVLVLGFFRFFLFVFVRVRPVGTAGEKAVDAAHQAIQRGRFVVIIIVIIIVVVIVVIIVIVVRILVLVVVLGFSGFGFL